MANMPSEIGPYLISRKLGEGGMGAVFEAVHQVIKRRVAIKVLHPEAGRGTESLNRFINEARAGNLIGHPGLVQITDFGNLPDGSGYLVMEYLEGETLSRRLDASGGKLPPEDVVHIGAQIASALVACHKKGIVHRDLKPGNVMLVPDPAMETGERLKVLDFGLAKLIEVREAASVDTQSQAVMGTPLYMSPEQCEGAGRVDVKTDVYALGCMLYEMLSGRAPFLGDGPGQVIGQHLFKTAEPLAKLAPQSPAALNELVERLLAKAKDDRPTMRETQKALEALAATLPAPRRREAADPSGGVTADILSAMGMASTLGHGAGQSERSAPRKKPILLIIVAASLAMLVGGVVIYRQLVARRAPTAPAVQVQAPPAAPKRVTTRVDSDPPGALVILDPDHQVLGQTPWQRQSEARPGKLELTLRLAGYSDQTVSVNLNSDEQAQVTLTPLPASTSRSKSGAHSGKKPVLKRISAPIKKLAGKIADKLKRKPKNKQP